MFEDKTYKSLRERCLSYAPEDVDTSEGSVYYDVSAPLCLLLAEAFADLSLLDRQTKFSTMTGEYLAEKANEYRVTINEALPWIYKYVYEGGEVFVGDRFFAEDYYYIISAVNEDTGEFYVECETVGTAVPKLNKGTPLIPVYTIQGLTVSEVGDVFRYPRDADTDDEIRSNVQKALAEPSENVNVAQVKKWAEEFELDGYNVIQSAIVYACSVYNEDTGTIKRYTPNNVLIFLNVIDGYDTDEIVAAFQEYIDPDRLGYGEGVGVIGTIYAVYPLIPIEITLSARLYVKASVFGSEPDVEAIKQLIMNKLNSYFDELTDSYKGDYIYIYLDNLKAQIQSIDGVSNCENMTICNGRKNIKIPIFKKPSITQTSAIDLEIVIQEVANPDDFEEYTDKQS